jgi:hypothetical protein
METIPASKAAKTRGYYGGPDFGRSGQRLSNASGGARLGLTSLWVGHRGVHLAESLDSGRDSEPNNVFAKTEIRAIRFAFAGSSSRLGERLAREEK